MAKLYGEIASSALMTFDKSFARANGQPLDSTEVYYSLASAKTYAAGAGAYIGQKIAVIENGVVTHYSIEDAAGNLKELGAKPIGDNISIEVSAGKISMHDFGKAFYKYYPATEATETEEAQEAHYEKVEVSEDNPWSAGLEPKVVDENGTLVIGWYEPNPTTIEGVNDQVVALQSTVAGLQSAVGVEGNGDDVAASGLFKEIDEVEADVAQNAKDIEALEGVIGTTEDVLGETVDTVWANINNLDSRVSTIEGDYLKAADKEELEGKIDAIEIPVVGVAADDKVLTLGADKLISATVAMSYDSENKAIKLVGKDGANLGTVDATPFIKDGMLANVEYNADNNTLTFEWNTEAGITKDEVVLSDIIEPYTAGNGLDLTGNQFSIKLADGTETFLAVSADGLKLTGVQSAIDTAKGEAIADAEGKIATAKGEAISAAAQDATDKSAQALADAKADAAKLYATKEYVGVFTTGEDDYKDLGTIVAYVNKKAEETLRAAQGGSSETAASVALALQNYKNENDPKVSANTTAIGTINEKLATIDTDADVNVIETVKVNGSALTPDENKAVDITVPTKVGELTDDKGWGNAITAAQTQADKGVQDAANAAAVAAAAQQKANDNAALIGTNTQNITSLQGTVGEHTTKITTLENANTEHNAQYNALVEIVNGHTETIAKKADSTVVDAVSAKASANESAIKTLNETTIPGINAEIAKKANADSVYTKTEIDGVIGTREDTSKTIVQMIADATYDDTAVKALITAEETRAKGAEKANADAIALLAEQVDNVTNIMNFRGVVEVADGEDIPTEGYKAGDVIIVGNQEYVFDENGVWQPFGDASVNAALISALDGRVTATETAITNINNEETGILALAKKYTDDQIDAIPAATADALGLVKVDNTTIQANEGVISVKAISTDLLTQGQNELILNGGSASN